jgi:ADP-heptose:LPS heptosyltransferase
LVEKPFVSLLENNPVLRQIQVYDKAHRWATIRKIREEQYDWILDFQSSPRSAIVVALSGAKIKAGYRVPFWGRVYNRSIRRPGGRLSVTQGKLYLLESVSGSQTQHFDRKIYLNEVERAWAQAQLSGLGFKRAPVGIIPTHRRNSRRWSGESFAALARLLIQEGYPVLLFWGPGEKHVVKAIQEQVPQAPMIPPASLREMAALLGACRLVVSNDNGPMHLAVAAGTPTITLYGPTDPMAWNPGGADHVAVQALEVPCLGCNLNECPFGHECMTHITPEKILNICRERLAVVAQPVKA